MGKKAAKKLFKKLAKKGSRKLRKEATRAKKDWSGRLKVAKVFREAGLERKLTRRELVQGMQSRAQKKIEHISKRVVARKFGLPREVSKNISAFIGKVP
jgi:hypothetical protein